jgi:hypothetical protein
MPTHIKSPTTIEAAGNIPKVIEEYIGRVNSKTESVSVAHMKSPAGWVEPGQTPEFDVFTLVLRGSLSVSFREAGPGQPAVRTIEVKAGEAIVAHRGEWVRYGSPGAAGAEYIAVCVPAFSIDTVHRDPD